MAISRVKVSEGSERLMLAIGEVIRVHTSISPMSLELIVGTLAYCAGAAIGSGKKNRRESKELRDMATANIDLGLQAMNSSLVNSSLILPDSMQ
jgi:hypothetical protein